MDKSNNLHYQEYIWYMRHFLDSDSCSDEKNTNSSSSSSSSENVSGDSKTHSKTHTESNATKLLATFVPDEVIYDVNNYSPKTYYACLLFGDVSGFTNLCEEYTKSAMGGASKLTVVLNNFIGGLIAEVISHGGDIIKFSGDAFLSMFKASSKDTLRDAVHLAIDSAISIQNTCGTYVTDSGLLLKVKLALSCGQVVFSLIGNEIYTHYVCIGQPVFDVKKAEKKATPGDIVLNNSIWGYIRPNEYIYEFFSDESHIKIIDYGINWRALEIMTKRITPCLRKKSVENKKKSFSSVAVQEQEFRRNRESRENYSIRPSVNVAVKMKLLKDLRKFIFIPSIMDIETDDPLEYLTEMRQVVAIFINVVVYKIQILHYIEIVDTIFKIVIGLVEENHGKVNKLTLFDKDLMIVGLFGLRGFKDEFECQNGLTCAHKCQEEINKIQYVNICSIGITTGMAYCGVVGHPLRREYTVIGISVNKAARLMMAYPGKVVCDRETFLHSKMENRHFVLQESRYLKGVRSSGAVYEFVLYPLSFATTEHVTWLPLLGRKTEMKIYSRMLETCLEIRNSKLKSGKLYHNHHSVLIINGKSRLGKTRLLEEMIRATPDDIRTLKIILSSEDSQLQLKTVQLIFMKAMNLSETSSKRELEQKILTLMQFYKMPQVLCCLNCIFKVDFVKSVDFVSLSTEQKRELTRNAFSYLSRKCFPETCVIAIDNGYFIDSDSWLFLNRMVEMELLFFVINIDLSRNPSQLFNFFSKNKRVRVYNLQGIDKWFHAGLACQFLDVQAIPPEVERLIHLKSEGNPGWIESYLLTLKHVKGITIKQVDESLHYELGLVKPPKYMLEKIDSLQSLSNSSSNSENETNNWKMFKHCCFEKNKLDNNEITIRNVLLSNLMAVCLITSGFNLELEALELNTMDVMIVKTFDSLTFYEQLLLKASSVIGDFFLRDMLRYIMGNSSNERETALAVKQLFEMKVLECAQGNYYEEFRNLIFSQRPSSDGIICDCIGYSIEDKDLPKYAFCGYMRFKTSIFRETTYNLLTDKQKKEFHLKAMKYLENETRRCNYCGSGFFCQILGIREENDLRNFHKKERNRRISYRAQSGRITSKQLSLGRISQRNLDMFTDDDTNNEFLTKNNLGVLLIKKLNNRFSLTRTFSFADFNQCQCGLILDTMYLQLLKHCREAGEHEKLVHAFLEYGSLSVELQNIPQALKVLTDAEIFLQEHPLQCDTKQEAEWRLPIIFGQIKTIKGAAYLEMGRKEEAFKKLHDALYCYGYPFPSNRCKRNQKLFILKIQRNLGLFLTPNLLFGTARGYDAEFCNKLSETLSLICEVYMDLNLWEHAELAATWSLNKALAANTDFCKMCIAFADMIEVTYRMGKVRIVKALEVHALRLCHRKKSFGIESKELKAVCRLYTSIFYARIIRSELEQALHIGYILNRIASNVHVTNTILKIFPVMQFCLLATLRLTDAATLLNDLKYYGNEDADNTGNVWYYALGLIFNLETGYTFITYDLCENFYDSKEEIFVSIRDPEAEKCFYIVCWLWCLRNNLWNAASLWYVKVQKSVTFEKYDSIISTIMSLYLLEGLLLYLVEKMDVRNFKETTKTYKEVNELINCISCMSNNCKLILPRLFHLKSYFSLIRNKEEECFTLLSKAKKLSKKFGNDLECKWIEHSQLAWTHKLPIEMESLWKYHCTHENIINYHETTMRNDTPAGLFTLPVPYYSGKFFF